MYAEDTPRDINLAQLSKAMTPPIPYRILLIDDEVLTRMELQRHLHRDLYLIDRCDTFEEAPARVAQSDPDAVITVTRLFYPQPESTRNMRGFDLARQLRANGYTGVLIGTISRGVALAPHGSDKTFEELYQEAGADALVRMDRFEGSSLEYVLNRGFVERGRR